MTPERANDSLLDRYCNECADGTSHIISAGGATPIGIGEPRSVAARRSGTSESELVHVIDAHEAVVERICAGDAVGAATAMSYHFDISMVRVKPS
jgi:hypothetical protein